jgi:uncharacterized membrane-anchored protein
MRLVKLVLAFAASLIAVPAAAQQAPAAPQPAKELQAMLDGLHPQTGDVPIPAAGAVLHLGKGYYFLPPQDAKRVLVEVWGNPPGVAEDVLGLVLPTGKTVVDDTWGAVITWEGMGHVSDDDAKTADYSDLMKDMQSGEDEINGRRKEGGYPAQHLVGWAQQPSYDPTTHSVVWAQNIAFEGQNDNSLNYDVRLLGRKGVLSLNLIDVMSKLPETRKAAEAFARSAEFKPGERYADFKPGVDTEAGIGIAGLVAAGVGVAAAKKLGILALIFAFGKKFIIIIVALLAGFRRKIARLFGFGKDDEEIYEPAEYAQEDYVEPAQEPEPPAAEAPATEAIVTEVPPPER